MSLRSITSKPQSVNIAKIQHRAFSSGQLRKLCAEHRKEDSAASKRERIKFQFGEGRPLFWWLKPREQWRSNWLESDIPLEEVRRWHERNERLAAKKSA